MTRDKRPQLSVKNKTDLMPNNASCKRWDTLLRRPLAPSDVLQRRASHVRTCLGAYDLHRAPGEPCVARWHYAHCRAWAPLPHWSADRVVGTDTIDSGPAGWSVGAGVSRERAVCPRGPLHPRGSG